MDKTAKFCLVLIVAVIAAGVMAPNQHNETDIINKYAGLSLDYPLGTDHLGRCVLSRLIFGVRPAIILSLATTIALGAAVGLISGYFFNKGRVVEEAGTLAELKNLKNDYSRKLLSAAAELDWLRRDEVEGQPEERQSA